MLFFQDEGRFGRINNMSKCWIPPKTRAIVGQQMIREYIYTYTAVCPQTGDNFSLILPYADTICMNTFLQKLSEEYTHYRIILGMDSAGWHKSYGLKKPENIAFFYLPPYSPELNPTEHIWKYIREKRGFNNYVFNSIEEIYDKLEVVLFELYHQKEIVKSMTNFNWISKATC